MKILKKKKKRRRKGQSREKETYFFCLERWHFEGEHKMSSTSYLFVLFTQQQINIWLFQFIQMDSVN